MPPENDEFTELALAVAAGQHALFEKLVPEIARVARRVEAVYLNPTWFPEFADEAPGLIYKRLLEQKFQKRSERDSFLGWCYTVLVNEAYGRSRKASRERKRFQPLSDDLGTISAVPSVAADVVRPSRQTPPTHLEQWYRRHIKELVNHAPLPDSDVDVIQKWDPLVRLLLPALCGFWHRVPPGIWVVWVYEAGIGPSRHFPSRAFFEEDQVRLRHEILARDLGISTTELSWRWRNHSRLLDQLSIFRENAHEQ